MKKILTSTIVAAIAATSAQAAIVPVTADITVDTTWSSVDEYILTDVIYITGGATLTIEAGTVVRGEPNSLGPLSFDPGTLVVTTEGTLNAKGTAADPIIFTTAAVDNVINATGLPGQDGIADGYDFFVDDNGTPADPDDDADRVAATGWTPGSVFLDADPKGSPLPPAIYTGAGEFDPIATFTDASGDVVDNEYRQLWGGLIVLGEAPVNTDVPAAGGLNRQFIEGLPPSALSAFGGFNPNDSSGVISFVSIRHGGAVIGSANEINGLTMGGVGFGTQLDHVEVYCNADDGFEWFGGTVNSAFLASIFNNDDQFDIDEGYTGLGQFWFALMNGDTINGDKGGEHDGETGDGNAATFGTILSIPQTYSVVYNATYIGNPNKATTEAFRIRDEFGGAYYNSIFSGFGGTDAIEISLDGEPRFDAGEVLFEGNVFFDANKGLVAASYGNAATPAIETDLDAIFSPAPNAAENLITDPLFRSVNRRDTTADGSAVSSGAGVNPLPLSGLAAVNTGAGLTFGVPETSTFFQDATFKGAFNNAASATLWTTGWTALNARGVLVDRGDAVSVD